MQNKHFFLRRENAAFCPRNIEIGGRGGAALSPQRATSRAPEGPAGATGKRRVYFETTGTGSPTTRAFRETLIQFLPRAVSKVLLPLRPPGWTAPAGAVLRTPGLDLGLGPGPGPGTYHGICASSVRIFMVQCTPRVFRQNVCLSTRLLSTRFPGWASPLRQLGLGRGPGPGREPNVRPRLAPAAQVGHAY